MFTIGLMPVKNEEWILEKSLFSLCSICDYVIVADQNSQDNTKNIIKKFSNCILINNDANLHSSNVRLLLLNFVREIFEGNNLLISLDADEIFSSKIENDIIQSWKCLPIGTSISLEWLQLWRSIHLFRSDESVWANNWKYFVYLDDRNAGIERRVLLDHAERMPFNSSLVFREDRVKVLHFQFVYFDRMLSKQSHYRIIEKIHGKKGSHKINSTYKITKDEKNIMFKKLDSDIYDNWKREGLIFDFTMNESFFWYDQEILSYFMKYGTRKFWDLDIWDIDWEVKRQMAIAHGYNEYRDLKIELPSVFSRLLKFPW